MHDSDDDTEIRRFLGVIRQDIASRGYRIKCVKSSRWNSWYLSCRRDTDGRHVRVRVSDHSSLRTRTVDVALHPGGDTRSDLLRWLK